jgi:type II secretory pathway pseudopilin PulG
MKPFNSRTRKGFGLLEVILVFAILMGAGAVLFYVAQRAEHTAHTDADRATLSAVAAGIGMSYQKPGWSMNDGGGPQDLFSEAPQVFAGNVCALDSWGEPGCLSTLTGQSFVVGALSGGGYSSFGPDQGTAFYVSIQGASQDDCETVLAGGPGTLGGVAAFADYNPYSGPTGLHALTNGSAVTDFCQAAADADGGTIQFLNVVYGNASSLPVPVQ